MSNTKPQEQREARAETSPAVDILESADEIRVIADLPGARREDIELSLERGQLVLVAKRQLAREGEALATARHEGDFRRAFRVPEEIEADEITASLDHGVLQIRLPKARRAQRWRIAVEAVA